MCTGWNCANRLSILDVFIEIILVNKQNCDDVWLKTCKESKFFPWSHRNLIREHFICTWSRSFSIFKFTLNLQNGTFQTSDLFIYDTTHPKKWKSEMERRRISREITASSKDWAFRCFFWLIFGSMCIEIKFLLNL